MFVWFIHVLLICTKNNKNKNKILSLSLQDNGEKISEYKRLVGQVKDKMDGWDDTLWNLEAQGTELELKMKVVDAAIELTTQSVTREDEEIKIMEEKLSFQGWRFFILCDQSEKKTKNPPKNPEKSHKIP